MIPNSRIYAYNYPYIFGKEISIGNIIQKMRESRSYLILSVGDSLTEGQRASGAENTYTAVFTRGLAQRFPDRTVVRTEMTMRQTII